MSLLLVAACAATPKDPFAAAQSAVRQHDLLAALLAYDAVPVSHPRYPEARAGAAAVEQRLQRGCELMVEGLAQRVARRDTEALQRLQQARDVWPDLPAVEALIAATRRRLDDAVGGGATVPQTTGEARPASRPAARPEPLRPTAKAPELPRADGWAPDADQVPAPTEPVARTFVAPADESVVLGLVAVEARLGRGELELAVIDLLELARRLPDDVRVQRRLARVLHQRALLRYGQGALTAALLDWERVLSLEPGNREVADLLRAVRAEASSAPASPLR